MRSTLLAAFAAATLALTGPALAQKKYDRGASDTEIKVGNFVPYSGPASAYGIVGQVIGNYVKMLNDKGGINGRKINFISLDDGYSPPKAVEQSRKLVENDEVLFTYQTLGTPSNVAVLKYMNMKKVPHLMISSGGARFGDYKENPWSMPFNAPYQAEGRIYAAYILKNHPNAKIAVLHPNDDYGKDIYKGVRDGLGKATSMIISEATYETSDPTVDSQIVALKGSGADLILNLTTPKFAAMAIRKMGELKWKPVQILNNVAAQVGAVIKPAGFENAQGAITATYIKDPTDAAFKSDPAIKEWEAFVDKYVPNPDKTNSLIVYAYATAQVMEQIIRQAGDNLTRENIMRQAESLKDLRVGVLMPGILLNTSPRDHYPIEQMQLMRFRGESWEMFGPLLEGKLSE